MFIAACAFTACQKSGICSYEEQGSTKYKIVTDKDAFYEEYKDQEPSCN